MTPQPIANHAVSRTFTTALLLTANLEQAEAATLDGIRWLDPEEASEEALFLASVKAAIASRRQATEQPEELDRASSILPPELVRVLRLSLDLRHCFVLRVLAGLSREDCARLLHLGIEHVDEGTSAAARTLAGIFTQEKTGNV
jgi:hypothetical protein